VYTLILVTVLLTPVSEADCKKMGEASVALLTEAKAQNSEWATSMNRSYRCERKKQ
jgi:hypothetical protein